ncbi:MAG: endonuclease III domain-containing protein, partial [Halobacteriaceae archaeon]
MVPKDIESLQNLPGVGPYTARALLIFAWNEDVVTVDTNIRRVLIHAFSLDDEVDE